MTKVKRYCLCGAAWSINTNMRFGKNLVDWMEREHTGEGHGPTNAKTAGRIRRQIEDKELRKERED